MTRIETRGLSLTTRTMTMTTAMILVSTFVSLAQPAL